MKLYVDFETLQLIEGPGFRNPVTSLRFKRGDAARLEVAFLQNGTTPVAIGDPGTLEIRFGVKPRNRYDIGYLVHDAAWTMPAEEAESPLYQCSPSFNTVELDSALGVGSSTGTELSEITLMGEITWREGPGEPTSTRTFLVVVENDVNRGTAGVPTSAEPPYPAAENVATNASVNAAVTVHEEATDPHPQYLRHDIKEALTDQQKTYVRTALGIEGAPYTTGLTAVTGNISIDSTNGMLQKVTLTGATAARTLNAPTNGAAGKRLELWIHSTTGDARSLTFHASILIPGDSLLTLPKNMTQGETYIVLLRHNGTAWMLVSLVGGYA